MPDIFNSKDISSSEFTEQILSDLIEEGYSESDLLNEFKRRQSEVRPSVEKMLKAAKAAAQGIGDYSTYEDIFVTEN